jgi:hypothetical protein
MDEETSVARQWCETCQVLHLPLHIEDRAPVKPPTKPKASRKSKKALVP